MNLYTGLIILLVIEFALCHNKYSKEANKPKDEDTLNMRDISKPYRMQKINLLWEKAKIVSINTNCLRGFLNYYVIAFIRAKITFAIWRIKIT